MHYTGTSATASPCISLTNLDSGQHQIKITPHGKPTPAGAMLLDTAIVSSGSANIYTNKNKLVSIDAPLTTMTFAPKEGNATSASFMFAYLFYNCTKLTTPAIIKDTYKLPGSVTNMSYFLYETHEYNSNLKEAINLVPLTEWFNGNTTINNMNYFLASTHYNNSSLHLEGQIIFPNWIKTMKNRGGKLPRDLEYSFYSMFRTLSTKEGDSDEPKFMDGTDLSSLGVPSTYDKYT
jgi:hypothetical protein